MTALRQDAFDQHDDEAQEQESLEDVIARFRASIAGQEPLISPPPSLEELADFFDHVFDQDQTVEDVVARIQASGKGRKPPPPSPEAIANLLEHVRNEQPLSPVEVQEWNKRWAEVFAEMRRIDEEDDVAEGRLP